MAKVTHLSFMEEKVRHTALQDTYSSGNIHRKFQSPKDPNDMPMHNNKQHNDEILHQRQIPFNKIKLQGKT